VIVCLLGIGGNGIVLQLCCGTIVNVGECGKELVVNGGTSAGAATSAVTK
jgi:hypothetical protein